MVTIKKGDTLTAIAKRELGTADAADANKVRAKIQQIARDNGIKDPNKIQAGKPLQGLKNTEAALHAAIANGRPPGSVPPGPPRTITAADFTIPSSGRRGSGGRF